jgi:DNA-damage-inducible protein J
VPPPVSQVEIRVRPIPYIPNATTTKAMNELESGQGKRFDNADALFKDLGI